MKRIQPNRIKHWGDFVNTADIIVVLALALYAFLYHLGRWQGLQPFLLLGGDAATIATFAAALDHPDLFVGDQILDNPNNFRFYMTVHIPLIRFLARLWGDYGSAFIALLGAHVFVQALGFDILGRVVFQNRFWAFLLAVFTMSHFLWTGLWDYWGVYLDPQPRFSFQALLPYLLAAAFHWRSQPSAWPWLMAAAGSLMYVHPVSAPAWAFAIWLGLWLFQPEGWSWPKRCGYILLMGLLFLAVTAPFMINYLISRAYGPVINYDQVYGLMRSIYGVYLDIPAAVDHFINYLQQIHLLWPGLLGMVGVAMLRRADRQSFWLIMTWLAGLLFVSVIIPTVEQAMGRAFRLIPVELDLIRGVRYLVPFLMLFWLWPLLEVSRLLDRAYYTVLAAIVGSLAVGYYAWSYLPTFPQQALTCWQKGQLTCPPPGYQDILNSLNAARQLTSSGSRFLPILTKRIELSVTYPLAIRYYALRPVTYAHRDAGISSYANIASFLKWSAISQEVRAIEEEPSSEKRLAASLTLADKLKADYVVIDFEIPWTLVDEMKVVYHNQSYTIIQITPTR